MLIRTASVADAEALTDLHLDVWEEAYAGLIAHSILAARRGSRADRIERWSDIIARSDSAELLAEEDGGLIGFISTGGGRDRDGDLPPLEVMALYVRAPVYGTGVGHRLLEAAVGAAPAYLWVLDGNERAIAFYERHGFGFDGVAKDEEVGLHRRMVRTDVSTRRD